MTESKRLAAHRLAALSASEPEVPEIPDPATEQEEDECPDTSKKDIAMTQEEHDAAVAKAAAEATATANQRFQTVIASEHYAGREQLAQTLLANDKMPAEDIVAALAAAPAPAKPEAAAALSEEQQKAAAEEAGRKAMQDALAENANSNLDPGNNPPADDKAKARAESDAVWAKAHGIK